MSASAFMLVGATYSSVTTRFPNSYHQTAMAVTASDGDGRDVCVASDMSMGPSARPVEA